MKDEPQEGERRQVSLLLSMAVSVCMCQVVNGVENMLDLETDLEITDQVVDGGLGPGGQLE
jgi:hypothetical protein